MSKMIFINLPVVDLKSSMVFYEALGFENKRQFTDDTAACMVWSESIYVMLLTYEKWQTFTSRPIPPTSSSEVSLTLSCDSRETVDKLNDIAAKLGGTADINPKQDLSFMYCRDLVDLDGHIWGMMWMDMSAMPTE